MNKEFICIRCPKGCIINVELDGTEIISMQGQTCNRGKEYVSEEITLPKRMVTSTVRIVDASYNVLPVVTDKPIEKKYVFELMGLLKDYECCAPVKEKDVLLEHVLGTDVNIIASRDMK